MAKLPKNLQNIFDKKESYLSSQRSRLESSVIGMQERLLNEIIKDIKADDERLSDYLVINSEFIAYRYTDKDKALKNHANLKAKHKDIEITTGVYRKWICN